MNRRGEGGESAPAIGIDLGTTYSCVGVWQHGKVEIIVNGQGNRTTPSYVAFSQDDLLVGDAAKNQIGRNPNNTVYDVKRLIGRKFNDPVVQNDIKLWPFKVIASEDDKPLITVQHKGQQKRYTAEEISSMVLGYMREIAEAFLATKVKNTVVTVPAYFNNAQREQTKAAGTKAGLNVMRVINEPTAAALAYGLNEKTGADRGKKNVLIFDLGGGTFDVSLITIDGGDVRVIATAGDSHLGGVDFDTRLVNYCLGVFERKHKKDISGDIKAIRKLRTACEKVKRILSHAVETTVEIDYLFGDIDFQCPISCAKFDDLNMDLFKKCMELVKQCLKDANIDKKDVDEVVLVGGSTRILKVQELLEEFFDGGRICKSINPEEAVACGAAIQAAMLGGDESMRLEDLVLRDVTPLPLGIGIVGGLMSVIIPKNTPIPVRMTKIFTTSFDYQTFIDFSVYEGDRTVAQDNNLLGEFRLSGIPQLSKLVPKIPVWFEIDENGILVVSAEDSISKEKVKITIRKNDGWTTVNGSNTVVSEIESKITRKVEARLRLENYAHDLRKMMKSDASVLKHGGEDIEKMEIAIDNIILWLTSNPNATTDELNDKMTELEMNWSFIITQVRAKDKKDVLQTSVDGQGKEQKPNKKKTQGFLACCGFGGN